MKYEERIGEEIIAYLRKAPFDVILEEAITSTSDGYLHEIETHLVQPNRKPFRVIKDPPSISDREPIEKRRRTLEKVVSYLKGNYRKTLFEINNFRISKISEKYLPHVHTYTFRLDLL